MAINRRLIERFSEAHELAKKFIARDDQAVIRDFINRGSAGLFINDVSVDTLLNVWYGKTHIKNDQGIEKQREALDRVCEKLFENLDQNLISRGIIPDVSVYTDLVKKYLHQEAIGHFLSMLLISIVESETKKTLASFSHHSNRLNCEGNSLYVTEEFQCDSYNGIKKGEEEDPFVKAKIIYKISFCRSTSDQASWEPQVAITHLTVSCRDPELTACLDPRTIWQWILDILKDFFKIDQAIENKNLFFSNTSEKPAAMTTPESTEPSEEKKDDIPSAPRRSAGF